IGGSENCNRESYSFFVKALSNKGEIADFLKSRYLPFYCSKPNLNKHFNKKLHASMRSALTERDWRQRCQRPATHGAT
ncbi:MAG TPA: hypothetical protein PLJ16_12405, partial [Casimicrobium huifangae]|nr:hypothetical protein [Casimicrobium huifangae]